MREREEAMSKLLMAFIVAGLVFMLFPGTLLGVWNLLQISGRAQTGSISRSWLQAHGHAQVYPSNAPRTCLRMRNARSPCTPVASNINSGS